MTAMGIPVTPACVVRAAQREHVPLRALVGLMAVEGGRVGAIHYNPNGSIDYGVMQINSAWLKRLARFHVTPSRLTYDGCANVLVGAWVLRHYWNEAGGGRNTIWEAIGLYHSHTPALKRRYEWQVYRRLAQRVTLNGVIAHANEWFQRKAGGTTGAAIAARGVRQHAQANAD
jgi:hypothetical protein